MLRKVRTYHSVYRFLAMTLLVTSVLSIIGHACLMDEAHAGPMINKCCCEKTQTAGHEGMHEGMKEMAGSDCNSSGEMHHDESAHGDCCSTDYQAASDAATRTHKSSPSELIASAFVCLSVQGIVETTPLKNERGIRNTSPPASPLARHILHSSFLI